MMAQQSGGGCLCGAVRYTVAGDPMIVAICHCRNCQRQSGSAFSIVGAVLDAAYTQTGVTKVFEDRGESGQAVMRHFCAHCGSPIVSIAAALPGLTLIKAGTLDDPGRWVPTMESYCDTALDWVATGAETQRFPRAISGDEA